MTRAIEVDVASRVQPSRGDRGVAACLAFRNAARYLREWLLFHLSAGIEYFFLYDNDSTDGFAPVVRPFVERGVAEVIDWPGYYQQNAIYDDCLRRGRDCEWLAFIDDDEFLFDERGISLRDALRPYSDHAGLAVPWYLYGSSGRIHAEEGFVIANFTQRRGHVDQHHKCIMRPARGVRSLIGGHLFECRPEYAIVDQGAHAIAGPTSDTRQDGTIRINHYLTKSIQELVERRTQRDIGTGDRQKLPLAKWIEFDRGWNQVEDRVAEQFLPRMAELADRFPAEA